MLLGEAPLHANGGFYDEDSGVLIVSLRHQDALVRIDPATGELIWILGNHDNWDAEFEPYLLDPVGPLTWPYHQHAPMIGPAGNILVFDNGNSRASPHTAQVAMTDSQSWSRLVEYSVDVAAMRVTQTWEYATNDLSGDLFSGSKGDADYLDNGKLDDPVTPSV
jgi:hypothetical protein